MDSQAIPPKLKCPLLILAYILFIAYIFAPLGILIWELVVEVRLHPATCQIKERVEGDLYDVFVLPENDAEPFSEVVKVPGTDPDDVLEEGVKLECFFRVDGSRDGPRTTVKFLSDRRKPDTAGVAIPSVWFAVNLVVLVFVLRRCLCKRDVPAVA